MVIVGLEPSYSHNQNGMTLDDMQASSRVAERLNEIVIYRSTGPWSKRWLERGYPSKNFHVKGKSSDWGPHAGLVPYDGVYSKVGYSDAKAAKGTHANNDGIASRFAGTMPLHLSPELLDDQVNRPEGAPQRRAIHSKVPITGGNDYYLMARRSGDAKQILFRAFFRAGGYDIRVYPIATRIFNPITALDRDPTGALAVPLLVMTSREDGADDRPMTGDYDLLAVCPSMAQYGSRAATDIVKSGIALTNETLKKGMAFRAGVGMDNVIDARLHTMGSAGWHDFAARKRQYQTAMRNGHAMSPDSIRLITQADEWDEHGDMGNLTPRILRCINELNAQMGATGTRGALRRVHHNAESHRAGRFAALTENDMTTIKEGEQYGDGFPLTVFQPTHLAGGGKPTARYGTVCTIENLHEFRTYGAAVKAAGFYLPRNMLWGTF
ncbi:MAG TPA: anthrax toxin-like adenylyl cyclase domain-containing protein [Gemmatimonadaceae bacterium]|jgi:hypothetical protein